MRNNIERVIDYNNQKEFKKVDLISEEIKQELKYHLYNDELVLL